VEGPEPKPAYRQVLVKVAACSLNFRDLGIVRGTYRVPVQDHIVPLSDGAGEVVEVGAGVTRVKVGDRSPPASSNAGPAATRPRMYRPTRSVAASTAC
jgi:NADPH:quinone reductase-like Zn-dependent oxidoreductase